MHNTYHDQALGVIAPGVLSGASDSDPGDMDHLTAVLVSGPSVGKLSDYIDGSGVDFPLLVDGSFLYTPPPKFYGTVTFKFDVTDGILASDPYTVTINVIENPPTGSDQTYSILHDQVLTVSPAGVLTGATDPDPPDMGKLTASLVSGPGQGKLSDYIDGQGVDHPLIVDGSFVYTPPPHWAGTVTFQYKITDGILTTVAYTATINVTDQAPVANDDQYTTGWNKGDPLALQPLIVAPSGVQQNDMDPDGDAFTSTVTVQPQHGTLSDYIDGNGVTHPLFVDGSFVYTPDVGYGGTDTIQYTDSDGVMTSKPATVTITIIKVDLDIFDGQNGSMVPDDKELTRGAYTVANFNDTQGNGRSDFGDSTVFPYSTSLTGVRQGGTTAFAADTTGFNALDSVIVSDGGSDYQKLTIVSIDPATNLVSFLGAFNRLYLPAKMYHHGRPEVDLMKLVVNPPSPVVPGDFSETVSISSGNATLWQSSNKVAYAGASQTFDIRLLPPGGAVLWVEAGQSNALRDIHVDLTYHGVTDSVAATGVWARMTAVEAAAKSAADVLAEFPDMVGGPAILVTTNGGTGVRAPNSATGVRSVIVLQFTISPSRLKPDGTVDGSWEADGVNFDIARQMAGHEWAQPAPGQPWVPALPRPGVGSQYPVTEEVANDDGTNSDESSVVVPDTGHFYVEDSPGQTSTNTVGLNGFTQMFNFREFVRVSIDSARPSGNGVSGSRASDCVPWHAFMNLVDDGTGNWTRTDDGAFDNEIGAGNGTIPDKR